MPPTARASAANVCDHVLNRGNHRACVFHQDGDFQAFVDLLSEAKLRHPLRVLAYCGMPNHFHLALWPLGDGDLGRWMHWLLTAHVRRYQRHDHSTGHVWQSRFEAFPIQEDDHVRVVLRYIERNPLRAGLVERAQLWPWCSLAALAAERVEPLVDAGPAPRGAQWVEDVKAPMFETDLKAIRQCVQRNAPFGSEPWVPQTAATLGLQSSLGRRGNPHLERRATDGL
jgi:putative transposase